ncbi:precorrin-2 C(20)-methyltransferase [Halarsenatibacter silvermanii]|uniref:Precorrin-2/cobalt-factor-2 C20-methyltransferase n=1 Tax=Halarsenatibacter silvermanii TaxID=321763 RepID=A0A1G9Q404_9FIRM|nr:precorrin-2 C(20)-methyltransferase [Halarsenatibacter silvermanii]SDM05227.1 precorrin-2/cobalt-factor-2 C20-methyltransferase [Halarsenatibacter silvermanii]
MKGKLYGVGVGPGDPDQLTLAACKILRSAGIICPATSSSEKESLALQIARQAVDISGKIEPLEFPMTDDEEKLKSAWHKAGLQVRRHLKSGLDVAFITLGDPLLYSTYIYLLEELQSCEENFEVETVPGVTAVTGCSSCLNLPLVRGDEKLAVVPSGRDGPAGSDELEKIVKNFETIVLLKVSQSFADIKKKLAKMELQDRAVFVSRYGQKGERIVTDLEKVKADEVDYLSSIIINKNNSHLLEKGAG